MDFLGKRVHFIGVGGVGVNALAKFVIDFGGTVSGSDKKLNSLCEDIRKRGARIWQGENEKNMCDSDMVVFSSAIKEDNAEYACAVSRHIPMLERHEFLAEIARFFGKTIAVGGTHGKTSTCAMITHLLKEYDCKFLSMIGGESVDFSNYVNNTEADKISELQSCVFVCEACEYRQNLLALSPNVAVVTNMECDHPDCYKDIESVKNTFAKFLDRASVKIVSFENADVIGGEKRDGFGVIVNDNKIECVAQNDFADISVNGKYCGRFSLCDGGEYNYRNATFAIAIARALDIDVEKSLRLLESYSGVKRRFEFSGEICGKRIYFDFAHHPSEIACVLKRAAAYGKILLVFQPHTYSRTKAYLNDFVDVLGAPENGVCVLGIMSTYAARELPKDGADSVELKNAIFDKYRNRDVYLLENAQSTIDFVNKHVSKCDVVLMVGAGDIYDLKDKLRSKF